MTKNDHAFLLNEIKLYLSSFCFAFANIQSIERFDLWAQKVIRKSIWFNVVLKEIRQIQIILTNTLYHRKLLQKFYYCLIQNKS